MNKLTADKCRSLISELNAGRKDWAISIKEGMYLQALEIALPVLEQQESPTDTYRQIENDGWIEWRGGERPVPKHQIVEVRYADGSVLDWDFAGRYSWKHAFRQSNIVAYRVIEQKNSVGL